MGSRMHFFRILWKDEIDKSNFYVRDHITGEKSPMKDYINTDEDGTKYFHIPTTLYVSYLTYDYSFLIPIEDSLVHFTKNGYFDSKGIQFQGRMSIQRMGDLLPFEYSPNGRE